jgi:Luciferase
MTAICAIGVWCLEMDAVEQIRRQVLSWEGVTEHPHRFGGVEFRFGKRELGHLHGDRFADLPFHRTLRDMLVETGRADVHHVLPDSGWVTKRMGTDDDVAEVIELFRLAHERARLAATRSRDRVA